MDSTPQEIPEFRDVRQADDGRWAAVHRPSGRMVEGDDAEALSLRACAVRIAETWRRAEAAR